MTPFIHFTHQGEEVTPDETLLNWSQRIIEHLPFSVETITFIHCSDDELLEINKQYLYHDYYTDIITFDLREDPDAPLEADLFLSADRIRENAQDNKVSYEDELKRVMIHGILHLCGYGDKTAEQVAEMREKENYYLSL
jgi:rRNA maturation RNase YbeY